MTWHVDGRYRERFPGTCEAMDAVAARLLDGKTWDPDFHRLDKRVRGLMDRVSAEGGVERQAIRPAAGGKVELGEPIRPRHPVHAALVRLARMLESSSTDGGMG